VQSTTMDSWKPLHLKMMELGGNKRFHDFLQAHGIPEDLPIREKYQTRAAAWYREALRAEAEGSSPPENLPTGTGHLLTCEAPTAEQLLLDRVFAQAPGTGSMTAGGVPIRGAAAGGKTLRRCGSDAGRSGSRQARKCALSGIVKTSRDHMASASAAVAVLLGRVGPGTPMRAVESAKKSARLFEVDAPRSTRSRSRSTSPVPAPAAVE